MEYALIRYTNGVEEKTKEEFNFNTAEIIKYIKTTAFTCPNMGLARTALNSTTNAQICGVSCEIFYC